ncbi:hypothetical protein [Bacillus sp. Marseille-P3800]|uniref:hypothetical protein n=1 Tax=Bacillus sp. Marseille-P3800 TaxID=2014782 RepID=UPI000C0818E4|nr:hypothetical protein [Bacillus sp. Marseille-P3800]
MKVYLVEKDNGESFEDNYTWIDGAYSTYRKASGSLLEDGYVPFYEVMEGARRLEYRRHKEIKRTYGDFDKYSYAKIIEMEVDDSE